ncbi:alpha-L-fucosidase [Neiella litorisoli]|uniref:alpha-L-fucosidase n=1 Tax=Neiella litorisoli TaxID=2771431 RepID=UPI001747B426|nr:alpha-L-fucosidase [Neiella litorisoli]
MVGCNEQSPPQLSDNSKQRYQATEQSLARHQAAPEWFRDAKLGIYFTWGPYTVAEDTNEWYPRWMHFDFSEEQWQGREPGYHIDRLQWHQEKFGHPSEFGYHDMIPLFTAENFDAEEWVQLFKDAGARFAGPVAMHHDGYALWDSQITPWNSAEIGPKRDITGELAAALRANDMKLITTFHHARHLQRYKGQSIEQAMQRYGHLNSYHAFWNSHYPWIEGLATSSEDPKLRLLYGNIPEDKWLTDFWLASLKEVVDNYQPDIVWFDTWLDQIPQQYRYDFAAYYLNSAQDLAKEVMMTHKDLDMPASFSVEDFEQGRRDKLSGAPWLTDDTISKWSWSYIDGLPVKPAHWVIHDFIDIVSKNGQLLLNVSPKADGSIPDDQRAVLNALGGWLKVNGDAIYGTRPWLIYGEGPTEMENSGHFTKHVDYQAEDIRFTTKGDVIYAIALGTPREKLTIVALARNNSLLNQRVFLSVSALNGDYVESWQQRPNGLEIKLKEGAPEQVAYAFEIK